MNNRTEPQLFADDLVIGQTFVGEARTVGDEQFDLFARSQAMIIRTTTTTPLPPRLVSANGLRMVCS